MVVSNGTYSSGDMALLVDILDFMHLQISSGLSFWYLSLSLVVEYCSILYIYELEACLANVGTDTT